MKPSVLSDLLVIKSLNCDAFTKTYLLRKMGYYVPTYNDDETYEVMKDGNVLATITLGGALTIRPLVPIKSSQHIKSQQTLDDTTNPGQ